MVKSNDTGAQSRESDTTPAQTAGSAVNGQPAMPQTTGPQMLSQMSGNGAHSLGQSEVTTGKFEYLISVRPTANLNPASRTTSVLDALNAMPDVDILDTIKPSGVALFSTGPGSLQGDIIVARTSKERGEALQASAAMTPDVIIERNYRLTHLSDFQQNLAALPPTRLSAMPSSTVQFRVLGENSQPLQRALITLWGSGLPVNAETDANGKTIITFAGAIDSVQAVYVKPFADYWERFILHPALNGNASNIISLEPLASFQPAGFGSKPFTGWGQKLMGLDQMIASGLNGQGAKIAIIDSGCDNKHPALNHITIGRDYTNLDASGNPDQQSWTNDTISHGTHCAGVIAGNGQNGIRGFAPGAEVHILKLFEGGSFDSLIKALKYAIDNQIHVVNCSLGADPSQSSELVQRWMQQARQAGVAVIVAAGNSAGAVQFPALLPEVMCVSAIGQQGDFPQDTYHAQTAVPTMIGVNGIFSPKFTCFGPQVRVCGPGVAIISSVPGGGYAAWDGTSMAAPHLTGLTALIAAHHPAFANKAVPRNADWVDRLFQVVMSAASSIGLNQAYAGVGLPSLANAFPQLLQQQAPRPAAQPINVPPQAFAPQLVSNIQVPAGLETIIRQSVTSALAEFAAHQGHPFH